MRRIKLTSNWPIKFSDLKMLDVIVLWSCILAKRSTHGIELLALATSSRTITSDQTVIRQYILFVNNSFRNSLIILFVRMISLDRNYQGDYLINYLGDYLINLLFIFPGLYLNILETIATWRQNIATWRWKILDVRGTLFQRKSVTY